MTNPIDNDNPYAAPAAVLVQPPEYFRHGLRIDGKSLVVPRYGCVLPGICVRTGMAIPRHAVTRKVQLHYSPPWVYILLLLNVLVVIIVSMIVRKSGDLTIGLSDTAKQGRSRAIMLAWAIFLLPCMLAPFSGKLNMPGLLWLLPIGFIASIAVYLLKVRLLWAGKIDEHEIWVRGLELDVMQKIVNASLR